MHIYRAFAPSPIIRENVISPSIDALSNPSDDGDSQTIAGRYDWSTRSPSASANGSRMGLNKLFNFTCPIPQVSATATWMSNEDRMGCGERLSHFSHNFSRCPSSVTAASAIVLLLLMITTNVQEKKNTTRTKTKPPPATKRCECLSKVTLNLVDFHNQIARH